MSQTARSPLIAIRSFACISTLLLTCAVSLPALGADDEEKDFFTATADGGSPQVIALDEILGKSPKTAFIPGRLYRNGQGALFIDGQRFVSPTGARDVAGFISDKGAYLIAVKANIVGFSEKANSAPAMTQPKPTKPRFTEDELQKLPPELRVKALEMMGTTTSAAPSSNDNSDVKFGNGKSNAMVFYRCASAKSCTIARVVKGLPVLHITETRIWFNDPSQNQVAGTEYRTTTLSYQGIDINGSVEDGPTGVLHAAPLPNGEWMIKRLDKVGVSEITFSWLTRSADGSDRVQYSSTDSTFHSTMMVVPTSIVIDATPVSPSAEYGTISVVKGGYEKLYNESYIFNVPVCAATVDKLRVNGKLMNNSNRWNIGNLIGEQLAVIPVAGKVYAFGQAKINGNVLGMTDVDCQTGAYPEKGIDKKAYATLEDGFFIFGNTYPNVTGLAGFVHIQSPNGNIILLAKRLTEGKTLPGIRVEDGKRIAAADANQFLNRYGIVNE